ncbi:MAG: AAA family ATPase [Natronospirillum sp.]|uniref:AAA family ATPase n=1 Tax=Natronospirillum sp. TaxID=2812955 RepID=UPI0025DE093C|nr:AAA family ATPase [Natronospirillum sp.]MCH8550404.1 AAA family ATPase [Natronospirillum sp.]
MPEQPSYVAYYGLKSDPFGDLAEPPFVPVGGRQQAVDTLLHLLSYSEDILFVVGPVGSGKSTLLEQFIRQLDETLDLVLVDVSSVGSDKELLWDLATQFHLYPDRSHSTQRLQLMLQAHTQSLYEQGKIPTLVIDDIDELPIDVLAGLSPVLHGGIDNTTGLRLVGLASDPADIKRELSALGFASAQMIELPSLSLDDSLNLLQSYFIRAGADNGIPLDANQLKRLYRQSQGRPGAFLDGVRDALIVAAQKSKRSTVVPWPHMVAGAAVIAVIALAALYQSGTEPEEGPAIESLSELDLQTEPLPEAETPVPDADGIDPDLADHTAEEVRSRLEEALGERAEQSTDDPAPADAAPDAGAEIDPDLLADLAESEAPEPAPEPSTPAAPSGDHPLEAPNWLREADSGRFTIQLLGARDQDNILAFAEQQGLSPDQAGYVRTQMDDSPWYVLVTGNYSDRDEARAAIEQLPEAQQALSPWPRTLGSLQGALP